MIGEPDAGKPHVRFDEGAQETCDIAARLRPTLLKPRRASRKGPNRPRGSAGSKARPSPNS